MQRPRGKGCLWSIALLISAATAYADARFTVRRMTRDDVPRGKGQCDIRLQIDGEVEVSVEADRVSIRNFSGRDGYDDGSECNFPMPPGDVRGFNFEVRDSRGDIRIVEPPSRRNRGRTLVRIRDSAGGFGRYHFRLSWQLDDSARPPETSYDRGLRIVAATWGAGNRNREVTRLLQDRVRDGRLRVQASNQEMGFDPAVGAAKELYVMYEARGRRSEVRVREGDFLVIP
jgi:hypothetical protein